ncbi:retrotransposon protein, putative, ty1-copia subclass [Tanacetum coccineum]
MVWVLVDLPPGCKTVGSKWIFKKKTDMDGIVHTYKARLVAKGYTQPEDMANGCQNCLLNGYLDEDIYMVQPEGFVDPNHPRKVCKLQRSIYGLKQASKLE